MQIVFVIVAIALIAQSSSPLAQEAILQVTPTNLSFSVQSPGQSPAPQTITITNAAGGALKWLLRASQPWLKVSPPAGTAPSTVTVSVDTSGLSTGSHSANITVTANAQGSPKTVTVTLTIGGSGTPPSPGPSPGPGNQLPIASFTYSPQNPKPGDVITFDCSPSRDPDGTVESCKWDFKGQGTHVSEQPKQHQHKFDREGTYTVTLTVKDNAGAESSTSQTITVRSGTTPPGPGPTPPPPSTGTLECLAGSDQFIEDLEMLSIIDAWIKGRSYKTCGAPTDSHVLQALNLWIKATVKVALHLITDRVSDDNAPGAARKQFSPEERTVYSFVKLEGRIGGQKVSWQFIDPQGKVYWSAEALLPSDKNIGVAWIQIAGSGAAQLPGRWTVKFYIDGRLQFEDTFEIIKSGAKPSSFKSSSRRALGAWRLGSE